MVKAIGFSLEDEKTSDINQEDFKRELIAKFGPWSFFGNFKSDSPQFWDANIKHPGHEETLSGVTASKAPRKAKPQELTMKEIQPALEETNGTELKTQLTVLRLTMRLQQEMP